MKSIFISMTVFARSTHNTSIKQIVGRDNKGKIFVSFTNTVRKVHLLLQLSIISSSLGWDFDNGILYTDRWPNNCWNISILQRYLQESRAPHSIFFLHCQKWHMILSCYSENCIFSSIRKDANRDTEAHEKHSNNSLSIAVCLFKNSVYSSFHLVESICIFLNGLIKTTLGQGFVFKSTFSSEKK